MNFLSSVTPFGFLKIVLPSKFIFYGHLIYGKDHFVSDYYLYPSLEEFDRFVSWLKSLGYEFVPLQEYLKEDSRKKILLTFDDGFKVLYQHLHPYMISHQIPYMIFVLTDPLTDPGFYIKTIKSRQLPKAQIENPIFLSEKEILEMKNQGVHIGFHSRGHIKVENEYIHRKDQLNQLRIPEQYRNLFSHPLCFAYPYCAPDNYPLFDDYMKKEFNYEFFFDTKGALPNHGPHFFRLSLDADKQLLRKDWMKFIFKRQLMSRIIGRIRGKQY